MRGIKVLMMSWSPEIADLLPLPVRQGICFTTLPYMMVINIQVLDIASQKKLSKLTA